MLTHHRGEDWARCEYRGLKTPPGLGNAAVGAGEGGIYGGSVPTAPAEFHCRGCSNMDLPRREPEELPEGGMGPAAYF